MKIESVPEDQISVRSHVARDLLQNAALFKNDKQVVWEYVSNGLDYIDEGTNPEVRVILDSKKRHIVIIDNGRGMDWEGLKNFFMMHGENIDRKKGRPGRGRFGTGKSAAFGIADLLRVTTVRAGKRSKVELRRGDIESMKSEDPIPVRILEHEIRVGQPNGTKIESEGIHLKSLDQAGVIHFIERHLAKWRNATVIVNNHECEFIEPPIFETKIFRPEGSLRDKLGDIQLIIKIAGAPLEEDLRGISIYANGVWHETTLAGNQGREMTQYILGEIDVPKLDEDQSPISPFDLSRSMQLNPSNELVQAVYAFIGLKIDQVRRELLRAEKQRKASEDAQKLAKQAEKIAQVINDDFLDFSQRLAKVKAKTGRGLDLGSEMNAGPDQDGLIPGTKVPAEIISPTGFPGSEGGSRVGGKEARELQPQLFPATPEVAKQGQPAGEKEGRGMTRGGFSVEFKPMGSDEGRALYVSDERTIYINIDHPQLVAARGADAIEDPVFQRLAFEIAFSEYAIALAHELNRNNEFIDTSDPIVSIRETINRIARKAANLYSKDS
jgi:hypothetical protein